MDVSNLWSYYYFRLYICCRFFFDMDKNDPGKSVSRPIVAPIKINSIYIDFSGYTKQQDGGSSHSHSPNR